ncbi:MAG TPA: 2Fe-2S iron-sulfur cluster binding domain-containing protein [Firmicutes bacterium]|nr:2Fe-2S iron-sulfur cluster binding domain-containing protein [Bacillota bacterium]
MINGKKIIVDGQAVPLDGEENLLEVIRKAGINLPTFCYHSELSVYGACRMCLVEVEGGGLVAACSTPPRDGMVIRTNTERVRRLRRIIIELLLANHNRDCTTCEKSGACKLQDLAMQLGVREVRLGQRDVRLPVDKSSPAVVRDPNKCILCGDCVRMCEEVQGIGVLDFAFRGSRVVVTPAFNKNMAEVDCVNCGQCAAVCPTGALVVKSEVDEAWKAIHDPKKTVIAQIAPAVRVAVGEAFGMPPGEIATGKIVAALRRIGFDKVFDTCFAADLTVMEETAEFTERLAKGERLPQFTSCCPAWVKFAEQYYPGLVPNISTCRSPQQMFGSVAKKFYARSLGIKPEDLFVISVMPCTAKKFEARRPEFNTGGVRDVDLVLTTQEVTRMIKESGISFEELEVDSFDAPFGFASGAGIIFGVTGGVAEAVLRAAYEKLTGKALSDVNFVEVRGMKSLKEATVEAGGREIRLAVVNGLGAARDLLDKIMRGEASYDLVEVMACPGGCVGGGGQPVPNTREAREKRGRGLYAADKLVQLRKSQDNPVVTSLYGKWLDEPNGKEAHKALHTAYSSRRRISGEDIELTGQPGAGPGAGTAEDGRCDGRVSKVDVAVCVGTSCYLRGAYNVLQNLIDEVGRAGLSDRVNLHATFCFERCDKGPSVSVNGRVITGVTPDKAGWVVENFIRPQAAGSQSSPSSSSSVDSAMRR